MRTELAVERDLFVFAHPDDEFACLESLRRSVQAGHEVICAYLTDGGYGGQAIEPRMEESRRALGKLGVAPASIHFLGAAARIPDGDLPAHMRTAYVVLGELVARAGPLTACFVPAWEGGHQDHDAAYAIVMAMRCNGLIDAALWQFSLYHGAGLPGPLFHVMQPLASNGPVTALAVSWRRRWADLRICMGYPSQWRSWLGLLPFVVCRLLLRGSYTLQRADATALERRPHAGKLLFERRSASSWEQLRAQYRALLDPPRPG